MPVSYTHLKRAAYKRQTEAAEKQGISNCPLCALGNNANKTRIYKLSEMDADHVTCLLYTSRCV